jgi:hypothetical protein
LLLDESEGVVVCGELSVPGGQSSPDSAPAPVVFLHSVVSVELVLLPVDVAPLSVVLGVDDVPVEPSARRIVPELCELPVSAVSESVSERML